VRTQRERERGGGERKRECEREERDFFPKWEIVRNRNGNGDYRGFNGKFKNIK
jgi:hypothetical protein